MWVVVAFALPGFVCIALINLPGYWQLFQLNDQTLGAVLSAAVFYLGLAAGFVEEAVFRGVFLSVLERRFHRWVGIVLPSVLFAALHLIGAQLDLAGAVQLLSIPFVVVCLTLAIRKTERSRLHNTAKDDESKFMRR